MSSPLRPVTPNIKDALSSMNISDFILTSPDYSLTSSGSTSFESSKNSRDDIIPPVFLPLEDDFPSTNIFNYASTLPNYFPAIPGNAFVDSLENSRDDVIPLVLLPFRNNPCLKDMQAFYAKESHIPTPAPITLPTILTSSPILLPSLLFDT
ncbi:hypothetical protein Tco_0605684 [Tanacetum coccineum]